jgi:hypothetical protein
MVPAKSEAGLRRPLTRRLRPAHGEGGATNSLKQAVTATEVIGGIFAPGILAGGAADEIPERERSPRDLLAFVAPGARLLRVTFRQLAESSGSLNHA